MKWEKQRRLRDELNARFPRRRGNFGQQMFRMNYYDLRMSGAGIDAAIASSIEAVRLYVPGFVPVVQ
jgi:hypothetical protein